MRSPRITSAISAAAFVFTLLVTTLGEAAPAVSGPIRVLERRFGNGVILDVSNTGAVPTTVSLSWSGQNVGANQKSPLLLTIPGKKTIRAVSLVQQNRKAAWQYRFNHVYRFGDRKAKHDEDVPYRLPFKGSYRLSQGFKGEFSHQGDSQFAVDFAMPEGTEVRAARDGVVAFVEEKFSEGGPNRKFLNKANLIILGHADGTIARYLHLQQNGAKVAVGQVIRVGDVIGLSGNTGYTAESHLHFEVALPRSATRYKTTSFKFADGPPMTGKVYESE